MVIGYYYETNELYFYNGKSFLCTLIDPDNAALGFYWNSYQYNKVSQFDDQMFSSITPDVVTFDYCNGRKNELVDSGFNLIFCNSDNEVISVPNTAYKTIFTKDISNTFFNQPDIYYALKNDGNSLILDYSISRLKHLIKE